MQSHQPIKITILAALAIASLLVSFTSASAQTYPGVKCIIDGAKQCQVRHAANWHGGNIYFASRQAADLFREMTKSELQKRSASSIALRANHQLALTGQYTQQRCPMTGKPTSKAFQVRVAGLKVYLYDLKAKEQLQKFKSTRSRAQFVFADSAFTKTFSPDQKKPVKVPPITPGANQPVSIADSSGVTSQTNVKQ